MDLLFDDLVLASMLEDSDPLNNQKWFGRRWVVGVVVEELGKNELSRDFNGSDSAGYYVKVS